MKRGNEKKSEGPGAHLVAPRRVLTTRVSALHTKSIVCGEVVVVVSVCVWAYIRLLRERNQQIETKDRQKERNNGAHLANRVLRVVPLSLPLSLLLLLLVVVVVVGWW
jgi:hypothetical protein